MSKDYKSIPFKAFRKVLELYQYDCCPEALAAGTDKQRQRAMVRQWQINAESQIAPLVAQVHHREMAADGDIGPATAFSFSMPRCGHPDYQDPMAQIAEANWPTGCRSKLSWAHRIPSLRGLNQSEIRDGLVRGFKNLSDAVMVGFEERQEDWPNVHFQERSKNLGSGGVLARHLLAHNQCNSNTWGEYNTVINWNFAMYLAVATHELFHGLGGNHVPGPQNLMNPSITQAAVARGGTPNANDLRELVRIGYTLRTDKPDPPDPPDPPNPGLWNVQANIHTGEINVGGKITVFNGGKASG